MSRIEELLTMLTEAARDDRIAGRMVWANLQDELVVLVRELLKPKAKGFQRGNRLGRSVFGTKKK